MGAGGGREGSSCLAPNGLWGVARSPFLSLAHPFLRPSGPATHPEPPHTHTPWAPFSTLRGQNSFRQLLLVPYNPPRHPTSSSSRFSGLVGLRGGSLVEGKGSPGSGFFLPLDVSFVLSQPPPPNLLSSPPFLPWPSFLVKFWGDLKRGPSSHSSRWPPGVRLCPAGRKS